MPLSGSLFLRGDALGLLPEDFFPGVLTGGLPLDPESEVGSAQVVGEVSICTFPVSW